jgi:transcriptional regulator with XRE-family HTH domain
MEKPSTIAANLARIIEEKGTNARAVADRARVGPTAARDIILMKVKSPTHRVLQALAAALALTGGPAVASCYGSDSFQTCTDESGNTYNVQRFGNTTHMQGSNSDGSIWSQQSTTMGNSTLHTGTAADGGNWNMQQYRSGSGTSYTGTDSDGNSINSYCTKYGCN